MTNKLLQVSTSDGLYLQGFYSPSTEKKIAILHIHGFEGNFYQNSFVRVLIEEMEQKQVGFLAANTRGTGKDTDFNTVDNQTRRIGAHYELLEEAHYDITAWVNFLLSEGYEQIVLMGHSLGTIKVVRYLFEGEAADRVSRLILLAPFDKKGYLVKNNFTDLEISLKKSKAAVASGRGDEIVSLDIDDYGMSYKTFISWHEQTNFGRMFEFCTPDYDFPILKRISIPTKIIVGTQDPYFSPTHPDHPEIAMNKMLNAIPQPTGLLLDGANHSFQPKEKELAAAVSSFVLQFE